MRTVEGVGRVAPTPVVVRLTSADYETAAKYARSRDKFRGYSESADKWKSGSAAGNPVRAIYWGLLGEIAFAKWLDEATGIVVSPDMENRRYGDGGFDFTVFRWRIQVKTAGANYDTLLFRTDDIHPLEPAWDVCVRCHIRRVSRPRQRGLYGMDEPTDRWVELNGWVRFDDFVDLSSTPIPAMAHGATWFNYELQPKFFLPMAAMASRIRSVKLRETG